MTTAIAALLLGAVLQQSVGAALSGPVPTSLWLEAEAGAGRGCDWHLSGFALLAELPDSDGCAVSMRLRGALNPAGARYFRDVTGRLREINARPVRLILDSRGGDADAAFMIANVLLNDPLFRGDAGGVSTEISADPDAVCFSGCLFVFAAGFERKAEFGITGDVPLPSRLGIHSPAQYRRADGTFDVDPANPDVQRAVERMRRYFSRVGVDPAIVDAMLDVPFDEIHLLSREEALRYRLVREQDLRD